MVKIFVRTNNLTRQELLKFEINSFPVHLTNHFRSWQSPSCFLSTVEEWKKLIRIITKSERNIRGSYSQKPVFGRRRPITVKTALIQNL